MRKADFSRSEKPIIIILYYNYYKLHKLEGA